MLDRRILIVGDASVLLFTITSDIEKNRRPTHETDNRHER